MAEHRTLFWNFIESVIHGLQNGGSLLLPEVEYGVILSFANFELEYNGSVENGGQTLPYGVVPLADRFAYCCIPSCDICLRLPTICCSCSLLNNER
ncbi:hypothetical protein T10_1588 [Trichinella papuae]|uniref:Uncharacterized protein n=1 Tax=Trichinella papuae TaxID=268474 RepID=A0A0V1M2Q7_9BILA|nr:hypothetical protein T10_1588 [Trichinella papuae]